MYNGAVLRNGHSGAFKVVMLLTNDLYKRAWVCVYESGPAKWSDIFSTAVPSSASVPRPSVLVGNALCWVFHRSGGGILEFDIGRKSLAVMSMPEDADFTDDPCVQILRTEDGGLGCVTVSEEKVQFWESTKISDHGVRWVLQKTVVLEKLISLELSMKAHAHHPTALVCIDEVNNAIILWTAIGVFMIQLESMKFTILSKQSCVCCYFPYVNVYTSGLDIGGGDDGAEMLDDA